MVGGLPSFDSYPQVPAMMAQQYPGPAFVEQPMPAPSRPAPRPMSAQPSMASASAPAPIVARGKRRDEEPLPQLLDMPTPEQFGIYRSKPVAAPTSLDWTAARRRLEELGAICVQVEKLPQGGYKFTCVLATTQPNRTHRLEAQAASEMDAVRSVLDQAEAWAGRK